MEIPAGTVERLSGGVLMQQTRSDLSQGELDLTEAPLDLAIEGKGFFVVDTGRGEGDARLRLSRDGRLTIDAQRRLVRSTDGLPVLSTAGSPIVVDPGAELTINSRGVVSQNGGDIATIRVVDIGDERALSKDGAGMFRFAGQVGSLPASDGSSVRQGMVERSGVDPIKAMLAVNSASGAVQRNARLIDIQDQVFRARSAVSDGSAKRRTRPGARMHDPWRSRPSIRRRRDSRRSTRLDVISNNLANVNTDGFKSSRQLRGPALPGKRQPGVENAMGGIRPTGLYVAWASRSGTQLDFTQGSLINTERPLDLAIEGDGFFMVQVEPDRAPDGVAYTRRQLRHQRRRRTRPGQQQRPALEPPITIPDDAINIEITSDGRVLVFQPGNADPAEVGRSNPPTSSTRRAQATRRQPRRDAVLRPPIVANPGEENFGTILQGFVEGSNVTRRRNSSTSSARSACR